MAQTFNDFAAECANYGHSKEHYDIMKECSEIALMEQYIDDQVFLAENVADLTVVNFTESYFMEEKTGEELKAIVGRKADKLKNLAAKIKDKALKILTTIINFFKKILAFISKTSVEAKLVYKALKDANISAEQYEALGAELERIAIGKAEKVQEDRTQSIYIERDQPFAVEINTGGNSKYLKYFAVALSDTKVNLGLEGDGDVVEANELVKILKKFSKDKKKHDFASTVKLIEAARADAKRNGVVVYANDKAIEKIVSALEDVQKVLEAKQPEDVESGTEQGEGWTLINETVGATTKQYGAYVKYRKAALARIKAFTVEVKNQFS